MGDISKGLANTFSPPKKYTKKGRWVGKSVRRVVMGGSAREIGEVAKLGRLAARRWVAKLEARLLASTALWARIQTSLKNTK